MKREIESPSRHIMQNNRSVTHCLWLCRNTLQLAAPLGTTCGCAVINCSLQLHLPDIARATKQSKSNKKALLN